MSANTINGDYSSAHLAAVFGRRTIERLVQGLDVSLSARLAASFAARVLEEQPTVTYGVGRTVEWVALCDRCDGYAIPNHVCPGGAL